MALGDVAINLKLKNVKFNCYSALCNFYYVSAQSNIEIENCEFKKITREKVSQYQLDIFNIFIHASGNVVIRNTKFENFYKFFLISLTIANYYGENNQYINLNSKPYLHAHLHTSSTFKNALFKDINCTNTIITSFYSPSFRIEKSTASNIYYRDIENYARSGFLNCFGSKLVGIY